ncbi:ribosome silencing factor [Roseicella aquatilis]|uniref:Ribosomal silencing factor RsfS n=1 Tax=Roseicella aquatilis TaxID=2527868 RepID=A0A4R4DF16_9PROT|nr:ribosome silencing factor [Roseicella aquatilis]TCZ58672.1 ribosome silencing factor [Roseicella aquatilis]
MPRAAKEATTKRQVAAGPAAAPKRARKEKLAPDRLEELVAAVRASLEDDKAEEIVVLDVTGRSDVVDRMIIATGQVERQLQAMATHVEDALEKVGMKIRRNKIEASPDWVLIDAGDLMIHLFQPEKRVTYGLERMWGPESPAPEAPPAADD